MLLNHYNENKQTNMIFMSKSSKRSLKGMKIIEIGRFQQVCGYFTILPYLHAWSDINATFGHGKKKVLQTIEVNTEVTIIVDFFLSDVMVEPNKKLEEKESYY